MVCAAAVLSARRGIDIVASLTRATISCGALAAIFFDLGVLALDDDFNGFLAGEDVAHDGLLALKALVDPLPVYALRRRALYIVVS